MIITIVGLGLIGGSLGLALRGFHDAKIIGLNRSESSLAIAKDRGAIDEGYVLNAETASEILGQSDLVILCQYPKALMSFIEEYAQYAKSGSIWTDVAGIKTQIIAQANRFLPSNVEFVGGHPMAGREVSGMSAALPDLFAGCNYIFCPTDANSKESLDLMKDLATYIGAGKIIEATPEDHDKMIAYTSQMAHVLAAAIVDHSLLFPSKGFEGGSFRDLTRVASLNAEMWSELFLLNKDALVWVLEELKNDIIVIQKLIEENDVKKLQAHLERSSQRKEMWMSCQV